MIHGFPTPYPDELFYSLVARRAARLLYPAARAVLREVFGTAAVGGTLEFPCRLRYLQQALPDGHPCRNESILIKTTLLPWYAPFLPPERIAKLKHHILFGEGARTCARAGVLDGRVPQAPFLRFCPQCLREDSVSGRQLYWRRLHQMTGIEICPDHCMHLEESQVGRLEIGHWPRFETPPEALLQVSPRKAETNILLRIAKLGQELLSGAFEFRGQVQLDSTYRFALKTKVFFRVRQRVRFQDLARCLREVFPEDYLMRTNCTIPSPSAQTWIRSVVRNSTVAPLKHLLLICALDLKLTDFSTLKPTDLPISEDFKAPQVKTASKACDNHLCSMRGKSWPKWKSCELASHFKDYVNIFECQVCGRVTGECENSKQKTWIKDYGFIWRRRLTKLWRDPTQSVGNIASLLKVKWDTVKRQAWQMGLPFPRKGPILVTDSGMKKPATKTQAEKIVLKKWAERW